MLSVPSEDRLFRLLSKGTFCFAFSGLFGDYSRSVFLFLFSVLDRFLHAPKRSSEFPLPRTLINYTNKY